ncbi:hypothetical protein J4558_23405 [Leptolyngbya sp. 15MV]|nr:hypothetical protein J4558_23405 [Leptolyngbya sp. 15MV]
MSQFGMQMPGARMRRSASMNVYTGLLFCAVVALAVACGFMWVAAGKVGANGQPFELQPSGRITLKADASR